MIYFLNDPNYLLKSRTVDINKLKKESINDYEEILFNKDDYDPLYIDGIENVLIPYNISRIKLEINADYFDNSFSYSNQDKKIVAPSLILLKNEISLIPPGYPFWFICAFAEVVWWLVEGAGGEKVLEKFEGQVGKFIKDDKFKTSFFSELINLYLKTTANKLECTFYNAKLKNF